LIGQNFQNPQYFHPRPSAAGEAGFDAANSSGSNLGPLSQKLLDAAKERATAYRAENELASDALFPADAVTASASGLDPHISVQNALLQAPRIAKAHNLSNEEVTRLLKAHIEGRALGIFGESRVNALKLNISLDQM